MVIKALADEQEEAEMAQDGAPITVFMVSLPLRRLGPVTISLIISLLAVPILCLVFLAPSLFVTDEPSAVLALWLEARAIVEQPPSREGALLALREGQFLYFLMINIAAIITQTPGQALLVAQGLVAVLLLGPIAYGAAMRLPAVPAVMAALLLVVTLVAVPQGALAASMAMSVVVFCWVSLVCYAAPYRAGLICAQAEGVLVGVGIWILLMSATPLFLLSLVGLIVALAFQGSRGVIFVTMALASLLVLAACSEILAYMTLGDLMSGPVALTLMRLDQLDPNTGQWALDSRYILVLVVMCLGLMVSRAGQLVWWGSIGFLLLAGAGVVAWGGGSPLPLILLVALMVMSSKAVHPSREVIGTMDRYALAGLLALLLLPVFGAGASIWSGAGTLYRQYQRPVQEQTAMLGFSFAEEPHTAELILTRKLDPFLVQQGLALSPADQAVLMTDGMALARMMGREKKPVSLVGGEELSRLFGLALSQLGDAEIVLTPKIPIDKISDQARVSSQGILYAQYRKADRQLQVSPVWDIWVRREN